MEVRKTIVAAGIAVGLTGCATSPEEAPLPKPSHDVSVADVKTEIHQAFDEARTFWEGQGISIAPSLAMPEDEVVTCGTESATPAKGKEVTAAACYVTSTLIVWPEALADQAEKAVDKGADMETVVALVVNHELGHLVQKAMNVVGQPENWSTIEPQADCLAGAAMREIYPEAPDSAEIYYEGIEDYLGRTDPRHGNAEQRLRSFMQGFAPPEGQNCDNVVPLG
jgi:hypothetical protein